MLANRILNRAFVPSTFSKMKAFQRCLEASLLRPALKKKMLDFFFSNYPFPMEVLKALVSRIARAFYDPKYIVILDELNNAPPNSNG